jgi:hypothetical protein
MVVKMDILKIIKDYWRLEFRLAVFIVIIALLVWSYNANNGCCGAVFIFAGVIDAVWIYAMRNNEEYES